MDNWNSGDNDSMVANLQYVQNAEGALSEQADIYAESWEAAQNRVKASAEEIYSALIDEDFFIDILNVFSDFLNIVKNLIDGLGGIKGVLATIASYITTIGREKVVTGISSLTSYFGIGKDQKDKKEQALQMKKEVNDIFAQMPVFSFENKEKVKTLQNISSIYSEMTKKAELLTDQDKETLNVLIEQYKATSGIVQEQVKIADLYQKDLTQAEKEKGLSNEDFDSKTKAKIIDIMNSKKSSEKGLKKDIGFNEEEIDEIVNFLIKSNANLNNGIDEMAETLKKGNISGNGTSYIKVFNDLFHQINQTGPSDYQKVKTQIFDIFKFKGSLGTEVQKGEGLAEQIAKIVGGEDKIDWKKYFGNNDILNIEDLQKQIDESIAEVGSLQGDNPIFQGILDLLDDAAQRLADSPEAMGLGNDILDVASKMADAGAYDDAFKKQLEAIKKFLDGVKEKATSTGEAFSIVVGQATSLISVYEQIKGAVNVFSDDDLSPLEKVVSLTTSLTAILPALANAFKKETVSKMASFVATKVFKKGTDQATASMSRFATAMYGAILPLAALAASILAIVAVYKLISSAVKKYRDALNADKIAAERAAKAASNLASEYDEIKSSYEEMISAMENYQTAIDGLDNLTKGTEEYKEALREANEQALALISQFGLIQGQDYDILNGQIQINEDSLKKVKTEQAAIVDNAYAASQIANVKSKQATIKSNITDAAREQGYTTNELEELNTQEYINSILGGALAGAIAGTVVPGVGNLVGFIVGGIEGAITGLVAKSTLYTSADKAEDYQKNLDAAYAYAVDFAAKDSTFLADDNRIEQVFVQFEDSIINAIKANKTEIQELADEKNEAENYEKTVYQLTAEQLMSNSDLDKTQSGQQALEAGGRVYSSLVDQVYDQFLKDASDRTWLNAHTDKSEALTDKYVKLKGLDKLSNFKITNYTGEGDVEYEYIDENGEEQTKIITSEEIASTLANDYAKNQLESYLKKLRSEISRLSNSSDETDQALASFLSTGNFEKLTKEQLEVIKSANIDDVLGLTNLSEEEANELAISRGYESAAAMREAFQKGLEVEFKEIPGDKLLEGFMTVGANEKIAKIYSELGETGGKSFVYALRNLTANAGGFEDLDLAQQTAMLDEISSLNWLKDYDAGEKAIEIAESYGVELKVTDEYWNELVNSIRDAADIIVDLKALGETLTSIKEITKDIDLGSIISAEVYDTLIAYNNALSNYFTILADGTAQFTGDILDFQQNLTRLANNELYEGITNNQREIDEFENKQKLLRKYANDEYRDASVSFSHQENQLQFLKLSGYDFASDSNFQKDSFGEWTTFNANHLADVYSATLDEYQQLEEQIEQTRVQMQSAINQIALNATSAEEREAFLKANIDDSGKVDYQYLIAYSQAVQNAQNEEMWEGLDATEVENYSKALMDAAENSSILADSLKNDEETAEDVALAVMKMNKGISSLSDGLEDWVDILENSDEISQEYIEALYDMKTAMSDILGISEEFISNSFIKENLKDIKLAAEGNEEAIDRLRASAAKDIILNLKLDETTEQDFLDLITTLSNEIGNLEVGADLNLDNYKDKINEMLSTSEISVEKAQALFNALGYEPEFETISVEQPLYNKVTVGEEPIIGKKAYSYNDPATGKISAGIYPYISYQETREKTIPIGSYSMPITGFSGSGEPNIRIKQLTKKVDSSMNNSSSTNKVGSGSSSKKTTAKKKTEVVDRYKEVTDSLNDVTRAYDRATTASEALFGQKRIDAAKASNELLKEEVKLWKQKQEEAKNYLALDKAALKKAASAIGVSFTFDDNNNITNYTEELTKVYNKYNSLVNELNASGGSESKQKKLEDYEELMDNLTDAIKQYDETNSTLNDAIDSETETFNKILENNYNIINDTLQNKIDLKEAELEYVDYYLDKIADDFYALAEAAELIKEKIPNAELQLKAYREALEEAQTAKENQEITDAKYVELLQTASEGILDQLSALNDLDEEMSEYYENTLSAASEELSKYTTKMEHLNNVLGHYKTLVELIDGEFDYKTIGKVLEAQAKTLKDELDASTEYYQMLIRQRKELEKELSEAITEAEREFIQTELDAINNAVNEAQEDVLSKTEEWAEAQKSIMENAMSEAAAAMEDAFTQGMGFDALSNSLSRLSSYADEYLTKTNQIYETQKLINTAQQAADKSTNEAAKARLKAYIDETSELQQKNKLSNLELEIAKAKYDVVLAEIALEEAQNAKSTVRLQRDSEGNFGYVYTADQDAISQAEQDLADAQNALYNIGLEGTNNYGQKLLELQQQLADDLIALEEARASGQYSTDEEYYAARDQLIQEYNNLFLAYSDQYTTALGVDTAIQEEAWVNAYDNMINKTSDWQSKVFEYTGLCEDSYSSWRETVENESEIIDSVLNDLETEIDNITEASEELEDTVVEEIIPALESELDAVLAVTEAYAGQREVVKELIKYYEELYGNIEKVLYDFSGYGVNIGKDYSLLMNEAALQGDWAKVAEYAAQRKEKIAAGNSDYGIDTDLLVKYLLATGGVKGDNINWKQLLGLASGGYTGDFGPEGRLALLHEKELVLNKEDTSNFLTATDILRDIVSSIDLKAMQNQFSTLSQSSGLPIWNNGNSINQNVTIEANFPNAQDRNEIQEAFNTLINKASQYANRK